MPGQSGEARIFLIQDDNLTAEVPLRRSILQSTLRQKYRSTDKHNPQRDGGPEKGLYRLHPIALVVDGFQATRKIRQLEGPNAAVPIIALTAHAMRGDEARCIEAGMSDYMPKPISRQRLDEAVRTWGRPAVTAHKVESWPVIDQDMLDDLLQTMGSDAGLLFETFL